MSSPSSSSPRLHLREAPRVAIVHDWLDTWRGGENVLAQVLGLFPEADLFAVVDMLPERFRPALLGRRARTSFLQRIPGAQRHFRKLLPLFPRAIESLDLAPYDLVLSISHAVAKGVRTHAGQLHVCYCLTPMRYAWDQRETYLQSIGAERGVRRLVADRVLDHLKRWDAASSGRVHRFLAISQYVAARIERCYGREATVVHPPVDVDFFTPAGARLADDPPYVTASRWVPYKRVDLIVAAFAHLPQRRLVVAGDGPDARRIRAAAGVNVTFVGELSREALRDLLRSARAFVFAAEEDFGILPVEAQACGIPVIAFGRGGALETLRGDDAGRTAVFFTEQDAGSIAEAVQRFESGGAIAASACRAQAQRFSVPHFHSAFLRQLEASWEAFAARRG